VLTVCGRVGLVEDGSTWGLGDDLDDVRGVPAARALGVERVDRPAGDRGQRRLQEAGLVEVSVWIATCTPDASATRRHASIAAGVVPQSSCSLNPPAPARSCSHSAASLTVLPLPMSRTLTGRWSEGLQHPAERAGARRDRGGLRAVGRAGAPAGQRGEAGRERGVDQLRADEVDVAVDPARGEDPPVAAMISVDGPMTSSGETPSITSGLPALPMPTMRPSVIPTSAFTTPQWSSTTAPVITRSGAPSADVRVDWPIDSRMTLPPPNSTSSPSPRRGCGPR
jgi:hypothetical protein